MSQIAEELLWVKPLLVELGSVPYKPTFRMVIRVA